MSLCQIPPQWLGIETVLGERARAGTQEIPALLPPGPPCLSSAGWGGEADGEEGGGAELLTSQS